MEAGAVGVQASPFTSVVVPSTAAASLPRPIVKRIGEPQHCWTLFWHKAEYVKPWGFLRPIEGQTATMWVPYNYPKDGKGTPDAWWETVPRGKNEPRRMPA
jgi:hypothetical protein